MKRFQARRRGGQFTRNTLENTVGLSVDVCPHCRRFNPRSVGEAPWTHCHACGKPLDGSASDPTTIRPQSEPDPTPADFATSRFVDRIKGSTDA